jgi:hypothetical protein
VRRIRIAAATMMVAAGLIGAVAASMALAAQPSSEPGFSKKTAIEVNVGGSASVNSAGSTSTDRNPDCGDDTNGHVVWFTFTPTSSQDLTADTFGSGYDTVLDVYQRGKLIDCNDDAGLTGCNLCSLVGFMATAGRTYYFKVAAFGGSDGGNAVLNLNTN